jgi:dTDP-3-amino-3,4,6-trideoxy-alpha-D-glucose transaminase
VTGSVPFVSLERDHAAIAAGLHAAFDRVVRTSAFILGEEVERFEREWAAACRTRHCVGVASGTAALTLMLQAAGVRPGDEVIVPGHTYIASALGVLHAGGVPVLCDVDAGTGLLDPEAVEDAIGPRTTAILAVHLYGQICDMGALGRVARRYGLALFEDAAQAHGARWRRRRAGGLGDGAAFSFYPSKNLGALGDGGAICTNDAGLAERVRHLRNLGQRRKGEHVVVGVNERLDGLQAALLGEKLPGLDAANRARRRHAAAYGLRLEGRVRLLAQRSETPCVYHLYPIRVAHRDAVAERLWAAGVETGVHYWPALHEQPALQGRVVVAHPLVRAHAWAAEELSLPMSPTLQNDEVHRAADACIAAVDAVGHESAGRFDRSLTHA